MAWTTAELVNIDDQKTLVIFTVVFSRDDSQEQTKRDFVADVEKGQVNADYLSDQATAWINRLNGVDSAKGVQPGPITLKLPPVPPTPNPERDAYLVKVLQYRNLAGPFSGMAEIAAAQPERDALKAQLEKDYKKEYFVT